MNQPPAYVKDWFSLDDDIEDALLGFDLVFDGYPAWAFPIPDASPEDEPH